MGKTDKTLTDDLSSASVSRRSFMKGAAALGAMASLYGCSKDGAEEIIYGNLNGGGSSTGSSSDDIYYTKNPVYRYGTSAHNCGGRCIIKAQVTPDGRIVRFLTDESVYTENGMGKAFDPEEINSPQFRACARCRSYKGRLYHPGRLKYPLKQTKKRGDVTGFVRISWEQALSEIAARLKAVQGKYGAEALHAIYACGNIYSVYQSASYNGVFKSNDGLSPAMRLLGGATAYTSDYSFHQVSYAGGWYGPAWNGFNMDGNVCIKPTTDTLAYGYQKYVVLWGANTPTTHNPLAYPWVKGMEEMRKKGGKVIFIGPEFSEIAVSQADEWIRIKPYTDSALVLGMLYHMLNLTIDANGQVTGNGLDLDYIDTMVYGFFESPAYWIKKDDGTITTQDPSDTVNYVKVDEVPAGKSLADYILGNDPRLTNLKYSTNATNYTATQFGDAVRGSGSCSYTVGATTGGATEYLYKKDFNTPKTPEWASEITGVPADKIRELANMYLDAMKNKHRIWNEWAGGLQKQAEGVSSIMAIQNLCILTKTWGYRGNGFMNQGINPVRDANANQLTDAEIQATMKNSWDSAPAQRLHPMPSVAQWHNAIKFAFGDQLKINGYTPLNIADWDGADGATATGHAYLDDGGVKALVKRTISAGATAPNTFNDGNATYYEYDGRNSSTTGGGQTNSGFRFILNTGGNIPVNQHPNSIDLSKMYEFLPSFDHEPKVDTMDEAFYMVTFDNFMSPSARYSDYVLPAKTTWEQEDFKYLDESDGTNLYIDNVIDGPGESKSTWDFARDLIKACGGNAGTFTGGNEYTTFKDIMQDTFKTKSSSGQGYFAGKTWEEFLEKPFITPEYGKTPDTTAESSASPLRQALEAYLNGGDKTTKGFITISAASTATATYNIQAATHNTHYGFGSGQYADPSTCPNIAYRFMVYMPQLQWCYENAYSKWHGHLPAEKRGQNNKDKEGDLIAYPITMYFNYEDYFAESYGVPREELTRENGYFLMTTTHDRFRAHSSQAENPYLRELTHRVVNGALYSGNDSGAYAVSDGSDVTYPAINSLIGADGKPVAGQEKRASYADIWVNNEDFANFRDGELVKVYNNVGAVYCTLRKTSRCVPGFVGLHQGCWYDPRTIGEQTVDVGGNCNTLMASRPSRYDHGNAAQSAMVKIERV